MAKKSAVEASAVAESSTAVVGIDLAIDRNYVEVIARAVPGDDSVSRKIGAVALGLLEQFAEGGIMIRPMVISQMRESLGRRPTEEEILEQFERGLQRRAGLYEFTVQLDPVQVEPLKRAAEFNSIPFEQYPKRMWDEFWDKGWIHDEAPGVARVLMNPQDYKELKNLLGKDFANGTELAALVKECLAAPGLFEEVK